jgi:hypothetical protein
MATASQQLAIYARRVLVGCALTALVVLGIAVAAVAHRGGVDPTAAPVTAASARDSAPPLVGSKPQVVEPEAGVAAPDQTPAPTSTSSSRSRAADDAEIRRELRQLKALAAQDDLVVGSHARVFEDGRAAAPQNAPRRRTCGAAATAPGPPSATTARGRCPSHWRAPGSSTLR